MAAPFANKLKLEGLITKPFQALSLCYVCRLPKAKEEAEFEKSRFELGGVGGVQSEGALVYESWGDQHHFLLTSCLMGLC